MGTLWSVDPLGGQLLRYAICLVLKRADRWMTVAEIVRDIRRWGFNLPEAANKAVADAIRWEVRRGRVLKVGRGNYAYGGAPRTTEYRMQQRLRQAHAEMVDALAAPVTDAADSLQHGTETGPEFAGVPVGRMADAMVAPAAGAATVLPGPALGAVNPLAVPVTAAGNSLQGGTEPDPELEGCWVTTKDGARALDLDALEALEARRRRKGLPR